MRMNKNKTTKAIRMIDKFMNHHCLLCPFHIENRFLLARSIGAQCVYIKNLYVETIAARRKTIDFGIS